jgi:hypothetical protein
MFNNCKHIRSRVVYLGLDTGMNLLYDNNRLIVTGTYEGTSANFSNKIHTIDSSLNVYTHTSSNCYAHQLGLLFNGDLYTMAIRYDNVSTPCYSVHKWVNYIWNSSHVINTYITSTQGLTKSNNYIWGFKQNDNTKVITIYVYDNSTSYIAEHGGYNAVNLGNTNGGIACYNNERIYFTYKPTGYYRPGYVTISGTTPSAITAISISGTLRNWDFRTLCNGKAIYTAIGGYVVVVDCATNTYEDLGNVLDGTSVTIGSVIDNKVYLSTSFGSSKVFILDTTDNSISFFTKPTTSIVYGICKGFNDNIFYVERDNVTKNHYLSIV